MVGRVLVFSGTVILLFVAYQLWGTGLSESHSQARLRQQFAALTAGAGPEPGSGSTTTSTSAPVGSIIPTLGPPNPMGAMGAPGPGRPVAVLRIPKIGADEVVVEGVDEPELALGPGHYPGTPFPGEAGNAAIAGHRTTYGHPFYNLDRLQVGDPIEATTVQGTFSYRVVRTLVVSPTDVSVLDPGATPELTLTTCNPRYSASQRLVVQAVLVGATPAASAPLTTPTTVPSTVPDGSNGPGPAAGTSPAGHLAGSRGDLGPAMAWGAACLAVLALTVWGVRRLRPRRRPWPAYGLGAAAFLAVLFGFFGAVTPLLPASF